MLNFATRLTGDVIDITSSDEDRPKTTQPTSPVNRRSNTSRKSPAEVVVISSDDETSRVREKVVLPSATAKIKTTSQPSHSPSIPMKMTRPLVDRSLSPIAGTSLAPSNPRLPKSADIDTSQTSHLVTATVLQGVGSGTPLSTLQSNDMLDSDPLDCLADSSGGFDAASSSQDVANPNSQSAEVNQNQAFPQQVAPLSELEGEGGVELSHPEELAKAVDTANGTRVVPTTAPRVFPLFNELHIHSTLTPIEADVALLNMASDGKDVRPLNTSRKPFLPLSGIYSSKSSGSRHIQPVPRPASTSQRVGNPYPTTDDLWGFAQRRLQRHTLRTGSTSDAVKSTIDKVTELGLKKVARGTVGDIGPGRRTDAIKATRAPEIVLSPSKPRSSLEKPHTSSNINTPRTDANDTPKSSKPVVTPKMTRLLPSLQSLPIQPQPPGHPAGQERPILSRNMDAQKSQTVCVGHHSYFQGCPDVNCCRNSP